MKRVFAVWAMAAALSPSVLANDQKQLADPFGTDVAGHDWSGIYGGAAVGLSTGRSKRVPWGSTPDNLANDDGPAKFRGTIAGGFAGYQYQFANNAVVGVEGDYEYSTSRAMTTTMAVM